MTLGKSLTRPDPDPMCPACNGTGFLPTSPKDEPGRAVRGNEVLRLLGESLCPATRYCDLFSRYRHNDKWDCHGDARARAPHDEEKAPAD